MEIIKQLFSQNIPSLVVGIFLILSAVIAIYDIIGKFSKIIGKPVVWVRNKDKDHKLLIDTAMNLQNLQKQHEESVEQSIRHDKLIKDELQKLTHAFTEKQINDYRWEIINLADKISSGKPVSKECYRHAITTYEKYESIISEHGLSNGEVEISIGIIKENYQKGLKEGF